MKRRRFLGFMIIALAIAGVTAWIVKLRVKAANKAKLQPKTLASICGTEKLLELGIKYRELTNENNEDFFRESLLRDMPNGNAAVEHFLAQKVRTDFQEGRTIMLDGWLLSITEARQCALMSLQESTNN